MKAKTFSKRSGMHSRSKRSGSKRSGSKRSSIKRSSTKRTKRMRSSTKRIRRIRRKMRGGTDVVGFFSIMFKSYPSMKEPTDFANLFFEKNFSDPANAWRFNKDKAVKNGFKVGVSPIDFKTFLDLAKEDKDLAKLYIISTDQDEMCLKYSYSHTESGTDSNQNDTPNFKLKSNHKRDPSLTLFVPRPKTDDFKSLDNGDETIYFAINLNDYEFNYSQDENDNFEALVALIRQKKKTETDEFNELVLTRGNFNVGYTLATGGSKRISKHRHTKRRIRGGGGSSRAKTSSRANTK